MKYERKIYCLQQFRGLDFNLGNLLALTSTYLAYDSTYWVVLTLLVILVQVDANYFIGLLCDSILGFFQKALECYIVASVSNGDYFNVILNMYLFQNDYGLRN